MLTCRLRSAADVSRAMQAAGRGGPTVADHRGSVAGQRKSSHMPSLHLTPDGLPGEPMLVLGMTSTRMAQSSGGLPS